MKEQILVVGASGKIGRVICRYLVSGGFSVTGLSQKTVPDTKTPKIVSLAKDLTKAFSEEELCAISAKKYGTLIYCAGATDENVSPMKRVSMLKNLTSINLGVERFIYFGSLAPYECWHLGQGKPQKNTRDSRSNYSSGKETEYEFLVSAANQKRDTKFFFIFPTGVIFCNNDRNALIPRIILKNKILSYLLLVEQRRINLVHVSKLLAVVSLILSGVRLTRSTFIVSDEFFWDRLNSRLWRRWGRLRVFRRHLQRLIWALFKVFDTFLPQTKLLRKMENLNSTRNFSDEYLDSMLAKYQYDYISMSEVFGAEK